jgi:hypothetical protein
MIVKIFVVGCNYKIRQILLQCQCYFRFDSVAEKEEDQSFPGRRRVASMISWLDYIDRVVEAANPTVAKALSQQVAHQLLSSRLEAAMLQA